MTILEKAALAERTARAAGEMLEHHGAFDAAGYGGVWEHDGL